MTHAAAAPADILEIFLQPGEFYFGDEKTRIRTLLGSCVAIVLWHPELRIGGMCHYMLPQRARDLDADAWDGRYAEDAMKMFMRELARSSTKPAQYHVKLFGAGQMFEHGNKPKRHVDIAQRNIEAGRELLERYRFHLHGHDIGGAGHRNVILDLWSGDVWLKRAVPRPFAPG